MKYNSYKQLLPGNMMTCYFDDTHPASLFIWLNITQSTYLIVFKNNIKILNRKLGFDYYNHNFYV